MKIYLVLISGSILLSFLMASMLFDLRENIFVGKSDIQKIEQLIDQFSRDQKPILSLNLSAIYPSNQRRQLIKADQYSMFASEEFTYTKKCSDVSEKMSKLEFSKSEVWESFRCNRIKKLPDNFFYTEPYIHESNHSFAFLAFSSGNELFVNELWLKQNIMFFHVLELKSIPSIFLDATYSILSKLNQDSLMYLEESVKFFAVSDLIVIKKNDNNSLSIFSKQEFENFINKTPYSMKMKTNDMCLYQHGGICFEKSNLRYLFYFEKMSLLSLVIVLIIFFVILIHFVRRLSEEEKEQENKKHALRILTHELRTPIANALLLSEQIANKEKDSELLDMFLKLEGEIYRLKRLAEKSGDFITSTKENLHLNKTKITDLDEFFRNIFDELNYQDFRIEIKQIELYSDPFWLRVVIKNLVENAIKYGKGTISLTVLKDHDIVAIEIEDQGIVPYKNFKELIEDKKLSKPVKGLGIGLLIVDELIKKLGASIELQNKPSTKFIIKLNSNWDMNDEA